jgi:hypothetical protein
LDEYQERILQVLTDGRWHHADELRFAPRSFDSQILALVRSLKSLGYKIEWRTSGTGDWYQLEVDEPPEPG